MLIGGYTHVLDWSLRRRARHLLPGDRQNLPPKLLKNNENSAPDFIARRVQGPEAVWEENLRRCGLENWE
jgi:hypothetical protein